MSHDEQSSTVANEAVTESDASPGGVLVAVDGSDHANRALTWAVREAAARGVDLTIMHTYHWPPAGLGAMEAVGFLMDALGEDSHTILAESAADAADIAKKYDVSLDVHTISELGAAVPALIRRSSDYELFVLGSRGLGGFAGMMLGSVSTGVVANAECSVAIIRGDDPETRGLPADAPVVVGVDGSPEQEAMTTDILRAAFTAAQQRQAPLLAVHVWQPPTARSLTQQALANLQAEEKWHSSVEQELTTLISHVAVDFPDVVLHTATSSGRPAQALLEHAADARLVVVGTRGHGEFRGMMLGSTSRALVQHAPCPVLVVR